MSEQEVKKPTKLELMNELKSVQDSYSRIQQALKEINAAEKLARKKEYFKEYKFKVHVTDTVANKAIEIDDSDYPDMDKSSLGFPIVRHEGGGTFILLKSESEIPRYKTLIDRYVAAKKLSEIQDKKTETKQEDLDALHKIILGEVDELPPMVD